MYRLRRSSFLFVSLLVASWHGPWSHAATITVTSLGDEVAVDAACTLREAMAAANGSPANADCAAGVTGVDEVVFVASLFSGGAGIIALTAPLPSLVEPLHLSGPGAKSLTVDAAGGSRLFDLASGATGSRFSGVALTGGDAGTEEGGAIRALTADLELDNVRIVANRAASGGGLRVVGGSLVIRNSEISGNVADAPSFGTALGGGIAIWGGGGTPSYLLENVTISGNSADYGGGVNISGVLLTASVQLRHATITRNTASQSGSGARIGSAGAATFDTTIDHSIIAGNTADDLEVATSPLVIRHSVIGVEATGPSTRDNVISGYPHLGKLAFHGGASTQTHSLRSDSPAADLGQLDVCSPALDQRGLPRPVPADGGQARCDAGAFEHQGAQDPIVGDAFHTIAPCRIFDSRLYEPLLGNVQQSLSIAGTCGIPTDARAAALNVTVISPPSNGQLELWPRGSSAARTSLPFAIGTTRAGFLVMPLGNTDMVGAITLLATMPPGELHVIIDASGYFQ
jgi:CSLREA domain-containing protein